MKMRIVSLGSAAKSDGQTMMEFAMVASIFLLLMFAIMQMALIVYNYNTVCMAAREAVRYAIVHSPASRNPATTAQIQQVAINNAVGLNAGQLNVTVNWPADAELPLQDDAQVKVSYQYQLNIPFLAPATMTLASTSQMLVSQ
jgi:Flp pilus assembly protein TadG